MPNLPPKIRAEIRRRKRRKAIGVIIAFFLVVLPFRVVLGNKGLLATWRKQAEVRELERKVEHLNRDNRRLFREIEELRQGGYAIERIAREELGLALPGEIVIHLPPADEDSPAASLRP
jgi:cell division protein FtsB